MSTVVVLVVVALLVAGALGNTDEPDRPGDEQLRRDTEDIAAYGAVVRPPLDDERRDGGCC